MSTLHYPREILDIKAVTKRIASADSPEALRARATAVLREALAEGRAVIRKRFTVRSNAEGALLGMSYLIDGVVRILHDLGLPHFGKEEPLAVVAAGGWGRNEHFAFSDVDILFLHGKKNHKRAGALAEWVLYGLWDLGLAVGQSVRTLDEAIAAAEEDITFRTNLLDARLVCGNAELYATFAERFGASIKTLSALDFVEAKLAERDARHQKLGDSRYVLEPNIKEGKGGLRDLHTLWWLARYIYSIRSLDELVGLNVLTEDELKSFVMARDFLWQVRLHMHFIAGRAEERLTFDMQRAVAEAMEYRDDGNARAVERFMKQYFLVVRTVGNLTRSVCAVLEEEKKRKPRMALPARMQTGEGKLGAFHLDGSRLAVESENAFEKHPAQLITLFATAHEKALDIHPHTLQLVTRSLWLIDAKLRRDDEANAAFMAILLSARNPEPTLRRMSEAGVLGRFIPDFGRVIGQMQFDMYHVFTVDEHTINAIGILHGIGTVRYKDELPIATEIIHLIKSRRVLFLSLFAHDIAKGRGGDHSLLGEVVVRKLARRFGFDAHETETCAWLVHHHLLMSRTAFKRDLADPKTIEDFVGLVQSPERLRLLLLLTVADIRAVGPNVWNGWKGALLRDLYYRAEEKMGASDAKPHHASQKALSAALRKLLPDFRQAAIDDYLDQGGSSFWSSCDAATHARIARILRTIAAKDEKLVMDTSSDAFRAVTDILLCAADAQGLFSRVSGAIALAGATILSAKIFTLKNGMAVELFQIQDMDGHAFDKPDKLARLSVFIRKAAMNELDLAKEIARTHLTYPSRMDVFKVPPRVFIENKASAHHTVIEVGGRDRIGFLYSVTRTLAEMGLTIATAHITTYGERAVDVFYVKDMFGMKIQHESKIRQIHEALIAALSGAHEKKQAG
jgi:[protein-PII] uridylyltransferase